MAGCTRRRRLVKVSHIVIFVLLAYTTTISALGLSGTYSLCHGSRRCLQQFEFEPPGSGSELADPASEPALNDPLAPDNSPPAPPADFLGPAPSLTPEPQPVFPAPTPSPVADPVLPGPAPTPEQNLFPPSPEPEPLSPAPAPTPVSAGPAPVIPPFGSVSPVSSLAPAVLPPPGGSVPVVPSPTPASPPTLTPTVAPAFPPPSIATPPPGTFDSPPAPPTPSAVLPHPPAAASSSESSNKSTVKAAVGATVGVSLFALVALGLIVFIKPEWLPCCGEDRRRQAQYERHMTDF